MHRFCQSILNQAHFSSLTRSTNYPLFRVKMFYKEKLNCVVKPHHFYKENYEIAEELRKGRLCQ